MRKLLIAGAYGESLINFRGPLIKALIAENYHVSVTASDISAGAAEQLREWGAHVYPARLARTGMNPFSDLRYTFELYRVLKITNAEILLTYTIKPNIFGAFSAYVAKIPSVGMVEGLGYYFTESGIYLKLKHQIVKISIHKLYRLAMILHKKIFFLNRDDVRDMVKAGCLKDTAKAELIAGTGIDLDHYKAEPLPEGVRFLMISRLLKNKGVREFAEAGIRLKIEMPDAHFDLVGFHDEGADSIDQASLERWMASGINYLGEQKDVRPFIRNASVYVLPSYREGVPRSSLEAMAMGRPILTTDVPGCRETVVEGENGLMVQPRDIDGLVSAMRKLAADTEMRKKMGARSLALARDRFEVSKVNADIIRVLNAVGSSAPTKADNALLTGL
jgi:glycosyltransferase involved in cell wall biosynthesis